jgi:multidrug efflux pump subunit AcrA (membrane-fusion protein)
MVREVASGARMRRIGLRKGMSKSSILRDVFLGFILPCAIVVAGAAAYLILGVAKPEQKGLQAEGLAFRLAALPEAEVGAVRGFDVSKTTLDIDLSGTVVPFRELNVGAEVVGRVVFKDPNCRQGRYVTKGQVLFRIDPQDYELEVQRLAKMLEQDYASLRELDQEVANIQKSKDVTDEELALHDAELERLQKLPEKFVSETELDNVKRARLASVTQQVMLQNQIDLAQKRKVRLEAAEKLAETQLKKAKLDLARCEIVSPVDGVIVKDFVESDSFIQRGNTLVTIEDTGNVEVSCSLRMDQLYWILDQQDSPVGVASELKSVSQAGRYALPPTPVTVEFHVAGREEQTYTWEGVLSRYEGSGIDAQSRTVPCRVRVERPYQYLVNGNPHEDDRISGPPALVRGMFVELKVHTKPRTPLIMVPKLAVKPGNTVWKFQTTDEVLKSEPKPASQNAKDKDGQSGTKPDTSATTAAKDDSSTAIISSFKVDEWSAGRLIVLNDIQVIRPYSESTGEPGGPAEEYWICEQIKDVLTVGDRVVVSPLAAVKGDGTDAIRVYEQKNGTSGNTEAAKVSNPPAEKATENDLGSKASQ